MEKWDVIIIGAGAAGLMCAIEAGKRGRRVLVLEQANRPGKKILMSGGGRCNFTNYHIHPDAYLSHNPHFCKSALSRYTQWDFIDLVKFHKIPFHEKTLGQLFCDHKSQDIVDLLLVEARQASVDIRLKTDIHSIQKTKEQYYHLTTQRGDFYCESLVIATGGLSIPSMGSSPFGYQIAEQFGLSVWPTRAGLVPLTWHAHDKEKFASLSGISFDSVVSCQGMQFREHCLLTHRGLSGPAILQISSYWQPGDTMSINLLPESATLENIQLAKEWHQQKQLKTVLSDYLPKRLIEVLIDANSLEKRLSDVSKQQLNDVIKSLTAWTIKPNGTEGYRTAEVTLGGIDTRALSSKTLSANAIPGLFFIGEVIDVTGWLGGYNFQWAWSSGWAAGQCV